MGRHGQTSSSMRVHRRLTWSLCMVRSQLGSSEPCTEGSSPHTHWWNDLGLRGLQILPVAFSSQDLTARAFRGIVLLRRCLLDDGV